MRLPLFLRLIAICLVFAGGAGAADGARSVAGEATQLFTIPAGPAEQSLVTFSQQSVQTAIFSHSLLVGVRTKAVHGEYTPYDALTLMLAGTSLEPARDEGTGALVVRIASGRERVVELPPYVVETSLDTARWSYVSAPGVEVISRCADNTTVQLLMHHFLLHRMLAVMLPDEFRVKLDVPVTYVLYAEGTQPGIAREVIDEVRKIRGGINPNIGGLLNYRFRDRDAVSIFFVIDEINFKQGRISLTPDYVRFMLESRVPSLPAWFIEGMMQVYQTAQMDSLTAAARTSATMGELREGAFALRPALWISETETQAVKRSPRQHRTFLSLGELFAPQAPAREDAVRVELWRSQAALLIRWALQGSEKENHRTALWEFIRRASQRPADEAMFRDCFGFDYATAEKQLRTYLPVAVKSTVYLRTETLFEPPLIEPREATDGEISRIKGGLDRLEIAYVKDRLPELSARYLDQARRTLRRAYDKGDRDPRLLAELGLCEVDAGDDRAARAFLDAATRGKVVRPRAYFELARLRFAELRAANPEGKFTVGQVDPVLRLLAAALKQSPQLPEVYDLIFTVWLSTEASLGSAQFAVIGDGVRNFQWHARLIYSAALLNSLHGRIAEARALVVQGLAVATTPKERERLLKLESALATVVPSDKP